jgi:hypothetical protein
VLAVDLLAVDGDVEDPAAPFDQLGFDVVLLLDSGRQTGGLWQVVSGAAVLDRDLHPVSLSC